MQDKDYKIKFIEIKLNVPYYSGFDPIDGSKEHIKIFKRRSCGIVSLKMILDFWSKRGVIRKITLKELIKLAGKHRAYSNVSRARNITGENNEDTGWIHSGLVKTVQDLGFRAWRRMWFLRKFDLKYFKKEGLTRDSLESYRDQIFYEVCESFKKSIDEECPFLVSVIKTLGAKKSPHLIVVTGYRLNKIGDIDGFFVNDPHNPKNGRKKRPLHKDQFISVREFDKIWRKRAIFVVPQI